MVEILVRFENLSGAARAPADAVHGSVIPLGEPERPPVRFDGWLQLLGILESLSSMTGESPEPPLPLSGPRPR